MDRFVFNSPSTDPVRPLTMDDVLLAQEHVDQILLQGIPKDLIDAWGKETCLKLATAEPGRDLFGFKAYTSTRCEPGEMFLLNGTTLYHIKGGL